MVLRNAFADLATEATLGDILTELAQKLEAGQEVALDAATLAALETINALVSGTVALDAGTLAALETIGLDAATLAALETISVANFPSTYPNTQITNRFDVVSSASGDYSTSGDHALITPGAGNRLRVVWFFDQATGALDTGVVEVKYRFGAGSYFYLHELTGSQPFAHGAVREGAVDEVLYVNTSSTARVLVNADYREF